MILLLTMPTLPFVFIRIDHTPTTRKIRLGLGGGGEKKKTSF
jgi:hypothetical protein